MTALKVPVGQLRPGDRVLVADVGGQWHPARTVRGALVGTVVSTVATGRRVGRRTAREFRVRLLVAVPGVLLAGADESLTVVPNQTEG